MSFLFCIAVTEITTTSPPGTTPAPGTCPNDRWEEYGTSCYLFVPDRAFVRPYLSIPWGEFPSERTEKAGI